MEQFLSEILKSPEVKMAVAGLVTAAFTFVTVYLREVAARLAARMGAMHAESVGRETGARGPQKMDLAKTHAAGLLPPIVRPRASRSQRLIEVALEGVRKSMPPPDNGAPN